MKLYKQILEAINRGILLALDDYKETSNNDLALPLKDAIKNNNSVKKLIDFYNNFVDLGLSSGTLWAKWNLGVNPKKLSKPKDWYGNYYAWGETDTKDEYSWETYKFGTKDNLTKYNKKDGLTELLLEDDVAYQFDNRMKMPTRKLFQELIEYTTNEWIENYLDTKGLVGILFTSKINSELMFIPASGYKYQDLLDGDGSYGCLWSSSLSSDDSYDAWFLDFNSDGIIMDYDHRYNGFTIHPVLNR